MSKIAKTANKRWTQEENEIIRKLYKTKTCKELEKMLPNRSACAIKNQAMRLGIAASSNAWSKKEINILKNNYSIMTCDELNKTLLPNKTPVAIRNKAKRIGIRKAKDRRPWTKQEDEIIKKYYLKGGIKECKKHLQYRTLCAIDSRRKKLNLNFSREDLWTKQEDEILKECYFVMKKKEIQEKYLPHRSLQSITKRLNKIKIVKQEHIYKGWWSKKEIEILKKYYPSDKAWGVQQRLTTGRTKGAIKSKYHALKSKHKI